MKPMNLLFIMSDQHNPRMMGCAGHPVVQTPNLDALAARGVRFTNAYVNCPICVPARASFATGRYVHQIRYWDNGMPYDGRWPSWGHRLVQQGHHVTTIGKLHYRSVEDDLGFPDQRLPMHVHKGIGDVFGMLRDPMPKVEGARNTIVNAGPGDSEYIRYDKAITEEAIRWLQEEARGHERPWVLFVSLASPHPPFIAPPEFYERYPLDTIDLPKQYRLHERPRHPALEVHRYRNNVEDELDEEVIRRARAAYYGLCSFLDHNVGRILAALEAAGLSERTRIIYTSDHGEMLGEHGLWFKMSMYDDAVGTPFIMAGPDLPRGEVRRENISLVDCFPTILDCVGARLAPEDADLPGVSLWPIARGEVTLGRTVFSEYHATGSRTGIFMLRNERYKYVYYVDMPPQLFDLQNDPYELHDLAGDPRYAGLLREFEQELRKLVDPEAVDRLAKADQRAVLDRHGGPEAVRARGPMFTTMTPAPAEFRDRRDEPADGPLN
ncbi:MAG TPA: sulfatase-like hydrolase/transferase [Chloroflexota bacterium]